MTDLARIGTTTYPSATAALLALQNIAGTQVIEILDDIMGADAFGTVNAGADATVIVSGVVKADGSLPELKALGTFVRLAWGKAIVDVENVRDLTIQNLLLTGAAVSPESNGAAVRINPQSQIARMKNCIVRHCEDGILGGAILTTIEDSLFDNNGYATAVDRHGYSHNLYLDGQRAEITRSTIQDSEFGHDLKSRCKETLVTQSRMQGSKEGRALDLSNGGVWISIGNEYIKNVIGDKGQDNLIHIGAEGVNDGRVESYTSTNDLFSIDMPYGKALEFVRNDGNVECVLIDPKFVEQGIEISDADAAKFLTGKSPVRIVLTGRTRGPLLPVGRQGNAQTVPAPTTAPAPAPTPVPVPVPTPVPVPATPVGTTPAPAFIGSWGTLGKEGDALTVAPNTMVRYGVAGQWKLKTVSDAFTASNDFFGGDPAVGIAKTVEVFTPAPASPVAATSPLANAILAGCKAVLEASGYTVTKK